MIYLDSAATTFQKPPSVKRAVTRALDELASPGRGGYPAAIRAADMALDCRLALGEMFGAAGPEQVNVKASTEERLGFTGDGSGMSAQAVTLLEKNG